MTCNSAIVFVFVAILVFTATATALQSSPQAIKDESQAETPVNSTNLLAARDAGNGELPDNEAESINGHIDGVKIDVVPDEMVALPDDNASAKQHLKGSSSDSNAHQLPDQVVDNNLSQKEEKLIKDKQKTIQEQLDRISSNRDAVNATDRNQNVTERLHKAAADSVTNKVDGDHETTKNDEGNGVISGKKGVIPAAKPVPNPDDAILKADISEFIPVHRKVDSVDPEVTEGEIAAIHPSNAVIDDDSSSSPTVVWFVLFSVVTIASVALYIHRSGLRSPSSLGFKPVERQSHTEEVPLMTPIDELVSTALLNLQVPSSAIDKYLQAFHNQRITHFDQLNDAMWKKLSLPSAIELELRSKFQAASQKPRSAGLTLTRDKTPRNGLRDAPNEDDMEFDDWSFDDEDINNEI